MPEPDAEVVAIENDALIQAPDSPDGVFLALTIKELLCAQAFLDERGIDRTNVVPHHQVRMALEVALGETAAFKALRREHRCRKNALEAVERMKRIVHEPTPREIAQLRFLDDGHTAAWLAAEEILVKLAELEGGDDAGAELLEGDEAPAPAS